MLLPDAGLPVVVHQVHVGEVLGAAAARSVEGPEQVRSQYVPTRRRARLPAALLHELAAQHDLVEVAYLEGQVIEDGTVRARLEEEAVMVVRARAAHEIAETRNAIAQPESQAV